MSDRLSSGLSSYKYRARPLTLTSPIGRVAAYDIPFPGFAREKANVPDVARVVAAARKALAF